MLLYILSVITIICGTYIANELFVKNICDENWFAFVICSALVLSIPITLITMDIENALHTMNSILNR